MFARAAAVVVALVVMVLLFSPAGMGQFKNKKKGDGGGDPNGSNQRGGGKKGGGGNFNQDPKATFEFLSQGKGFIVIAEARFGKDQMEQFAKDQNITDGKLTLQQYLQYKQQNPGKGPAPGSDGKGRFGPGGVQAAGSKPAENKPAEKSRPELEKMAEEEFKKRDANGDGKLNYDEMDAQLRREMVHYDKNQDQLIDQQEFTAYFIDRYQQAERDKSHAGSTAGVQVYEDDLDVRPVVFRYGKLPKDLPEWFTQFDTNQDGLVSLSEWVNSKSGKAPEEFAAMDRDGDGLLTPEEVLRFNNGGAAPSEELAGGTGGAGGGFGNRGPGGAQGAGNRGGFIGALLGGMKGGGQQGGQQAQFGPGGRQGGKGKGGGGKFGPKAAD